MLALEVDFLRTYIIIDQLIEATQQLHYKTNNIALPMLVPNDIPRAGGIASGGIPTSIVANIISGTITLPATKPATAPYAMFFLSILVSF